MRIREIKPVTKVGEEGYNFFDPMTGKPRDGSPVGSKAVCVCGFELVKESENTLRCTGGNHRYHMDMGQWCLDKFGNVLLKIPINKPQEDNKNE